jgi:hypothetical protein
LEPNAPVFTTTSFGQSGRTGKRLSTRESPISVAASSPQIAEISSKGHAASPGIAAIARQGQVTCAELVATYISGQVMACYRWRISMLRISPSSIL